MAYQPDPIPLKIQFPISGKFGVTEVSPDKTWVTVAEWMQTFSPQLIILVDNARGADNSVYAARIQWQNPNDFDVR
ncbi:MAG: hypothetical protein CK548_03885 [Opitutia bacterium]|nr:MAG: hypothetical protein CK548_03885 [Opitutae bacterium]